ncbi:type I methionyl aminopeptidase [Candidatus Nomurabacteria bacterium]|nr:type I methionyl aminopeptidase [Candidatus Nomurabacteria bacterium]
MKNYDQAKINDMREAGKICSKIFSELGKAISPGVKIIEIDNLAEKLSRDMNVLPAFKGYEGFPASICASLNDIVVHGIPDTTVLSKGDILGVDFGIKYRGVYSDMSFTFPVGKITLREKKLISATKDAVLAGVSKAVPGNKVGDIGAAMQKVVEKAGYSVVREMVGHGIGHHLHEDPYVPGYGRPGRGETLYRGQTLAIEAIVNEGSPEICISAEDGWTTYTEDGMLSALFEHTIVVDETPEILTNWD